MPEDHFKAKYPFNKSPVQKIIEMFKSEIELDKRGCGTSSDLPTLMALRCWGRRDIQDDTADLHGLSQATVCKNCTRVARAFARRGNRKSKMPSSLTKKLAHKIL